MKISSIDNYNASYQVNYRGGLKSLNIINPASHYLDKYFNKMAEASVKHVDPVSSVLADKIRIARINNISAWDINPAGVKEYVLFLHGMSQNVSNYQRLYETIAGKNKGVFALEYRGYGLNSSARISEDKLRKDVEKAYNYLTEKKQVKPENITVIGHSMGGALAADFASKHDNLKALILISPISKISYLGGKFMQNKNLGVGMPEKIKKFTDKFRPLSKLLDLRFNSINKMKKISVPTYILQSKNDSVTTKEGASALIKTARRRGVLKDFRYLPLGGHKVDSKKISIVAEMLDKIYG